MRFAYISEKELGVISGRWVQKRPRTWVHHLIAPNGLIDRRIIECLIPKRCVFFQIFVGIFYDLFQFDSLWLYRRSEFEAIFQVWNFNSHRTCVHLSA